MGILGKLMGNKPDQAPQAKSKPPSPRYRGVQIVAASQDCCSAAKLFAGQRFRPDEIPKLPLERCDAAECRCTYKLYNDRRTSERRLSDFGHDIVSQLRTGENQRGDEDDRRST